MSLFALMLAVQPPMPVPQPATTITIRSRYWYSTCIGKCVDYDLTVQSDGAGTFRRTPSGAHRWSTVHFQVAPARFAAFRDRLSGLRPAGIAARAGNCPYSDETRADLLPGIVPLTVEWSGPTAARLESCSEPASWRTLDRAFEGLGFSVRFGRVMKPGEPSYRAAFWQ